MTVAVFGACLLIVSGVLFLKGTQFRNERLSYVIASWPFGFVGMLLIVWGIFIWHI